MRLPLLLCRLGFTATLLVVGPQLVSSPLRAAAPIKKVAKKPITHDVYDGWRSLRDTSLSRNGEWLVVTIAAQEGDGELLARNLKTGQEWRHPRGNAPVISAEGRFVAFAIAPPKADVDKAKKDKKKPEEMPKTGLGVMDLTTGKVDTLDRVKSFRFGKEGGRFLAALLEKA
ncbi:MAG: hypothetical protein Q8O00_12095, partial [Holophaga sp.]|nr:hypothetical protein [Holophaga sp.]